MATILNGATVPATETGENGDFYIDTVLKKIHGPKDTTWPAGVSLVGPTGAAGAKGDKGDTGNAVLNGVVPPTSNDGVAGDFFIDTHLLRLWGPRTTNWTDNSFASIDRSIAGSIWATTIIHTPSDWTVVTGDGDHIVATNSKTGEVFDDTIANFNIKIAVNGY